MVFLKANFSKANFVAFTNSNANITKSVFNFIRKYLTPVLGRKYQMVQEKGLIVALGDMITHITTIAQHLGAPQGAGNYTLLRLKNRKKA